MNQSTKKILIVKIGAIGDVVMALSMLNAIDLKYPGAEITWICGRNVEPLLQCFNRINRLIVIDEKSLLTGNIFKRFIEILKTWRALLLSYFDIVVVAYRDSRYKILTWTNPRKLTKILNGKDRINSFVPGRYHSDEYAKLILEKDDWEMEKIGVPEIKLQSAKYLEEELSKLHGKKIILNPGGAKNLINPGEMRRWPTSYYSSLAAELIKKSANLILIGAETDMWVQDYFKDMTVTSFIGKTTLPDLVYLFNKCDLLISHDTAAIHLAKLSTIKVIALFGPTNPQEMAGKQENIRIIYQGEELSCSPCYNGKSFADCSNNVCMKNISVEKVFKIIMEYVNQS